MEVKKSFALRIDKEIHNRFLFSFSVIFSFFCTISIRSDRALLLSVVDTSAGWGFRGFLREGLAHL